MRLSLVPIAGVTALLALVAPACGGGERADRDTRPVLDAAGLGGNDCPTDPIDVVVSVAPWTDLVTALAGGCADVTTIVRGEVDPHEFEPTPRDLTALDDADLVVVNGLGYDRWATDALDAVGTVLSLATALGVLFASAATTSSSTVTSVLFGNLLAVSGDDLVVFGGIAVAALVILAVIARPLLFASVTPEVAEAQGVPVRALGIAFLLVLALVVTMAVQVVGTLLLFALVVTPAATALAITARPATVVALSGAFALGSVWLGLVLSAMFDLPPSFPIVSLSVAGWAVSLAVTRPRRRARATDVVDDHHHHDH